MASEASRQRPARASLLQARNAGQIDVDDGYVGLVREIGGIAGLPIGGVDDLEGRVRAQQRLAA